ncbi:MAG: DoxX family protein [Candidatus Dormibacteraeota bacterium]|nr:DoxX family protein [Candidatus Dormibacteraeota bacterium]
MTLTVLAALLALGFATLGLSKVMAHPAMRERSRRLGFSVAAYRRIGLLEIAGAAGVLLGLLQPVLGVLAAGGLLLLLCGALGAHLRRRDGFAEAVPALLFGLVDAAYLGLSVAVLR